MGDGYYLFGHPVWSVEECKRHEALGVSGAISVQEMFYLDALKQYCTLQRGYLLGNFLFLGVGRGDFYPSQTPLRSLATALVNRPERIPLKGGADPNGPIVSYG